MLPLLLILIFALFALSIVFHTILNGISPMPSSRKATKQILEMIPKNLHGTILELGSGWGTLAFPIAKQFPNSRVIAYENSPIPYLFTKLRLFVQPRKNLTILFKDFYKCDLSRAQCVVCYLYPGAMKKLQPKFKKELKPGTCILSHTFTVPGLNPTKSKGINDLYQSRIYLYQNK